MKNLITTLIILLVSISVLAQDIDTRVVSLKNKLELLKVETPGLEEQLTINISQTTLSNFLLAISEIHKLNINVAPELNSINLVNNFTDVSVEDVLIFLVKEYDLDIDFTGNIMSIKKRVKGIQDEREIKAIFNPTSKLLHLDLKNDKLERVFRKIMDISGKNLLFSPEIENTSLTLYIKDIPFDLALEKLAETNNLILTKSRDGFYVFDADIVAVADGETVTPKRRSRRSRSNFSYKILDTINKRVAVDFQNTSVADVIYTLGEELQLNIFTASPLDKAGMATVKADDIDFDLLLDKIFESALSSLPEETDGRTSNKVPVANFTYKRDGDIYYFGTENQLSLKQIELVTMMYRSIQLLANPSGKGQRRSNGGNFQAGSGTTFGGGNSFNQGQNQNQNNRNNNANRVEETTAQNMSIEDIIPKDITDGLDIRIDVELNSFVVSGPGVKVERFKDFITYIDKPVPMILIEVMILEVNRSAIVETGVSFGLGEAPTKTIGSVFPEANINIGAETINKVIGNFNGFGSLNLGKVLPEFYLDIKAMETNGNIKVLSTPKLSTINGHKAYLSSGETSYYAVTTQNIFGSQNPQTTEIRNYLPIDAELSLEIMPFVSGNGEITLDVQVIQSNFNGERIAEDAPPGINSREFSSIVRMRDQDVAILGGIEEVRKDDSGSGVPLLSRVPVLKWLFSKKRREDSKRKLNILIKPTVIN